MGHAFMCTRQHDRLILAVATASSGCRSSLKTLTDEKATSSGRRLRGSKCSGLQVLVSALKPKRAWLAVLGLVASRCRTAGDATQT